MPTARRSRRPACRSSATANGSIASGPTKSASGPMRLRACSRLRSTAAINGRRPSSAVRREVPLPDRRAAIVTGGAAGIGLAIARHLLEEGMAVVAADRDEAACAAAQTDLAGFADRLRIVTEDIGTEEGAARTIAA